MVPALRTKNDRPKTWDELGTLRRSAGGLSGDVILNSRVYTFRKDAGEKI
jgi:hypothetical protein